MVEKMKVIERTIMTDGTKIQLEDWFEHNTEQYPDLYGLMIGAYPIAKNTGKYGLIRRTNIQVIPMIMYWMILKH